MDTEKPHNNRFKPEIGRGCAFCDCGSEGALCRKRRMCGTMTGNGGKAVYHVEDAVLYGSDGICRISEIVTRDFGGAPVEYYVLKPIRQEASTIYVPVNNEALVHKMRHVLPEEPSTCFAWISGIDPTWA